MKRRDLKVRRKFARLIPKNRQRAGKQRNQILQEGGQRADKAEKPLL